MRNNLKWIGVAAIAAFLVGCESRSFQAEREMFRAHKKAEAVYKNPKGTPPFQFQLVLDAFQDIIKKYPESLFGVQASFSIGHLFVIKGDFEKGREQYKTLAVDCDKKGNLCAEAYFAIGNSYELQQDWPAALAEYQRILRDFPLSSKSLDLPLYIVRHYRKVNDPENTKRFVDEAASYYLGLKSKAKTDKGMFILQNLVSRTYIEGAQWQDALDSLDKLMRDFPDSGPDEALWVKALIYYNQLKDPLKAKQELQKIINDHPRSKLAKQAEGLVKKL
jgi:tetratricopeptide (TPR) repeat protein